MKATLKIERIDRDVDKSLEMLARRAMSGIRRSGDGFSVLEGPGTIVRVSNRRYSWSGHVWKWAQACNEAAEASRWSRRK